jgi:phosphotransferase system  glucose/maltose/N-acetylglucosamine-specific IIC component
VKLEDELNTETSRRNNRFKVRTLEPLEAGSGIYLPAGAEIIGHISRVESAGIAGRAKIWLTFDDIKTNFGPLPIVAEVVAVPGDHSVKGVTNEGLIEGRTSTQQAAAQAAAGGAALGAVKGVKDKNKKEIAEGAATAALAAYLTESGRGHELDLPKGAKLEVELERALYLVKE